MTLRTQGYLTQDDRGHGHDGYARLRFRQGGHFRTIYLGRDGQLIECVRAELCLLRRSRRLREEGRQLQRQARKTLRDAKQRLAGPLQKLGWHYHGDTIRKIRRNPLVED